MRKAIAATVAAAALAVGLAPAAQADANTEIAICIGLSESPTTTQLTFQAGVLLGAGFSEYSTGWTIGHAISRYCPEYTYVLEAWTGRDLPGNGFLT